MGYLTTHILDTMSGLPAAGVAITLFKLQGDNKVKVAASMTNNDGRCDNPILPESMFEIGKYEIEFSIGEYFQNKGIQQDSPHFLDEIIIRFGINNPNDHYHVPLLVSPYGYSTYKGS